MTRPDKHVARFGDRYRPRVDYRRFLKSVRLSLPLIRSITAVVRRIGEGLRDHTLAVVPSQSQPGRLALVESRWAEGGGGTLSFIPHVANMAAPTLAELEAGTPLRVTLTTGESVDGDLVGPEWSTSYARSSGPVTWTAASVTATQWWTGRIAGYIAEPDDRPLLDRIDDTLLTYDSQRSTGEQPWPYRGF